MEDTISTAPAAELNRLLMHTHTHIVLIIVVSINCQWDAGGRQCVCCHLVFEDRL